MALETQFERLVGSHLDSDQGKGPCIRWERSLQSLKLDAYGHFIDKKGGRILDRILKTHLLSRKWFYYYFVRGTDRLPISSDRHRPLNIKRLFTGVTGDQYAGLLALPLPRNSI